MTEEQINIAIAEACGWTHCRIASNVHSRIIPVGTRPLGVPGMEDYLPDYLNDLNAMREAEKVLDAVECQEYFDILDACLPFKESYPAITCCFHYSAQERAEAFCRAKKLGKWKEEV